MPWLQDKTDINHGRVVGELNKKVCCFADDFESIFSTIELNSKVVDGFLTNQSYAHHWNP